MQILTKYEINEDLDEKNIELFEINLKLLILKLNLIQLSDIGEKDHIIVKRRSLNVHSMEPGEAMLARWAEARAGVVTVSK